MLTNPLIIATVAGLLVKASGLTVPQTATIFLAHLGNDSLAMGLLCIGAGLDPVEAGVAILFAALPTAQSCYVMTASMKGDAPSVANVTTAQTLAAMATLPFWISTVLIGLSPIAG